MGGNALFHCTGCLIGEGDTEHAEVLALLLKQAANAFGEDADPAMVGIGVGVATGMYQLLDACERSSTVREKTQQILSATESVDSMARLMNDMSTGAGASAEVASSSVQLASQGGARAKVQEIDLLDLAMLDTDRGISARCTWIVSAAVGHWGHIHQRINQYEADFEVRPVDGVWKITAMDVLQEERL